MRHKNRTINVHARVPPGRVSWTKPQYERSPHQPITLPACGTPSPVTSCTNLSTRRSSAPWGLHKQETPSCRAVRASSHMRSHSDTSTAQAWTSGSVSLTWSAQTRRQWRQTKRLISSAVWPTARMTHCCLWRTVTSPTWSAFFTTHKLLLQCLISPFTYGLGCGTHGH